MSEIIKSEVQKKQEEVKRLLDKDIFICYKRIKK